MALVPSADSSLTTIIEAKRERLLANDFVIASYQMEQVNHGHAVTYQVTMVVKARKAGEKDLFAIFRDFQDDMNLYKVE